MRNAEEIAESDDACVDCSGKRPRTLASSSFTSIINIFQE